MEQTTASSPLITTMEQCQQTSSSPLFDLQSPVSVATELDVSNLSVAEDNVYHYQTAIHQQSWGSTDSHGILCGILKLQSSYPRPLSLDDQPPIPIASFGKMRNYTKDKYGKIIPFHASHWFKNIIYENTAQRAIKLNILRRLNQKKERAASLQQLKKTSMDNMLLVTPSVATEEECDNN